MFSHLRYHCVLTRSIVEDLIMYFRYQETMNGKKCSVYIIDRLRLGMTKQQKMSVKYHTGRGSGVGSLKKDDGARHTV